MMESSGAESYRVEYTDEAKRFLYRRRATTHATFFLPYLNLASAAELQTISEALRWWGDDAAAFAAEPWGKAVAWRS